MSPRSFVRRSAGLAIACALGASCSSAPPPPPVASPPVTVAATAAPEADPEPAPDLAPVAEPAGLVGVLRVGNPIRDLVILRDLVPAHLPIGRVLAAGPEGLSSATFGALATEIDSGLPLDIALFGDGSTFVGSVVLRDLDLAKKAGAADFDFRAAADGSIAVVPRRKAKNATIIAQSELACGVYPGGTPLRQHLVCAPDKETLALAAPYLARTVGARPEAPGVRFDVPAAAMTTLLADRQSKAKADVDDSAGARLATSWMKAFTSDLGGLSVELAADQKGVSLSSDVTFRSTRSPLSLIALTAPGGPVPAMFWSVPKDADVALALPGAPAITLQKAMPGAFWSELTAAFAEDVEEGIAAATAVELRKLFLTGGPLVFAHGPAPAIVVKPGVPPRKPAADPAKRFVEVRDAFGGWALVGAPEPITRWTAGLHELVRLGNHPGKKSASDTTLRTHSTFREVPLRPADKLPAGTLHIVFHETPNAAYVRGAGGHAPLQAPIDTHLFVGGSADLTWMSVAPTEALARAKLQAALAGGEDTLAKRADLEPLRAAPVGGLGFATLKGAIHLFSDAESTDDVLSAATRSLLASQLPSGGADPIFLRVATRSDEATGGANLHVALTFSITAALDVIQYMQ